jgi:hypothetical protein
MRASVSSAVEQRGEGLVAAISVPSGEPSGANWLYSARIRATHSHTMSAGQMRVEPHSLAQQTDPLLLCCGNHVIHLLLREQRLLGDVDEGVRGSDVVGEVD